MKSRAPYLWAITLLTIAAGHARCDPAVPQDQSSDWARWNQADSRVVKARVEALEYLLRARGYQAPVDGKLGPELQRQVESFQRHHGLAPTGRMDDPTWAALIVTLKPGDRGPAVTALQVLVNSMSRVEDRLSVTGSYNSRTLIRVKQLRKHGEIRASRGSIDEYAWEDLIAPRLAWDAWSKAEPRLLKARVQALQYLLCAHGSRAPVDGRFGAQTQRLIAVFQHAHGLPATGAMDDPTWEALVVTLKLGDRGPAVNALQVLLNTWVADRIPGSGVYDRQTLRAAEQFQNHSVDPDGVVDRLIWHGLFGGPPNLWDDWNKYEPRSNRARVEALQYLLRARGYLVSVDGNFGPETGRQIAAFQRSRGLRATGSMDDLTWDALVVTLKPGAKGPAVTALQVMLRALLSDDKQWKNKVQLSGVYDATTLQAAKRFQTDLVYHPNGLIDRITWNELIEGGLGGGIGADSE